MAYSKEQFRTIFQNKFDREAWKAVVIDIFGANRVRTTPELFTEPDEAETGYYMGSVDTPDAFRIGLFYYKINSGSVAHKKVGLRNLVKRFINQNWGAFDAAIVVFNDNHDWRLSFVCDIKEEATAPKRFTFVFGEKDSFYRTAIDRFYILQNQEPTFENIRKAFSVDALSDDFFDEYRELYADFVQYITGKRYVKESNKWVERAVDNPDYQYETTFGHDDKLVRDYIKKMFGRIVFLYFLQRKGWLDGNRQYMHDLFYTSDNKDNFLDGVLEPLFFEVLNTDKPYRTEAARALPGSENIPYLNGGLFAQDDVDALDCVFPRNLFKRLFDFLDSYNFTIDENDTDDAEIGIDPEMLGRIFENLLEDNKDKGAFYTPKEIVRYMCRESLIEYLKVHKGDIVSDDEIWLLVEKFDGENLSFSQRKHIKDKLKEIKICDPAIGSGAFPMGLVNLLSKIYQVLKLSTDMSTIKRHIMEQNIYGVDIEQGAVDIARLRFWLAMIVEEKEPIPLPNLHFKIMQGNSLLESYRGIDLSDLTKVSSKLKAGEGRGFWDTEDSEREALISSLKSYYTTSDHTRRERLFNDIINNVRRQLYDKGIVLPNGEDPSANTDFFLWHTWFSDVFENGGFDIVIGNPPYGAKYDNQTKKYYKDTYVTANSIRGLQKGSLDTYTLFIELGYYLLRHNGSFAYIVPISLTSSDSLTGIHRILLGNCDTIHISSYAVRPKPVFENAFVNTSILLFQKTGTPCRHLYSTKMHRRGNEFDLQNLIDNLQFIDVKGLTLYGRIPKIGSEIEKSILDKLFKQIKLGTILKPSGSPIIYRFAGGRYFKVVTNYSNGSSAERTIYFANSKIANAVGCILSSNLSFWFYQIFSDNLNWKTYEIENFTIPQLTNQNVDYLNSLYVRYLADIESNANTRVTSGESTYNVDCFKEYKIVRSKSIIDEIDDYICPLYRLTHEETDFIKNYELEFRLAGE